MTNLATAALTVLAALRSNTEYDANNGFRGVYLDNARPKDMTAHQFRAQLAVLSKAGLYKVVDGADFGEVKMG